MRIFLLLIAGIALQGAFAQNSQTSTAQIWLERTALQTALFLTQTPAATEPIRLEALGNTPASRVPLSKDLLYSVLFESNSDSSAAFQLRISRDLELQKKISEFQAILKERSDMVQAKQEILKSLEAELINAIVVLHLNQKAANAKYTSTLNAQTLDNMAETFMKRMDHILESLILIGHNPELQKVQSEEIIFALYYFSKAIKTPMPILQTHSPHDTRFWNMLTQSLSGAQKWHYSLFKKSFSCRKYFN